jgi:tetratricopeptide (TPR) repeat protein
MCAAIFTDGDFLFPFERQLPMVRAGGLVMPWRGKNSLIKLGLPLLPLLITAAGCMTAMNQRVKDFSDDGLEMFARGDFPAARDSFEAALTLTPQDPALLYNLGQCYDRMGDWRQAEQYYLACMEMTPTHGDARQAQASLLYRTGRAQEANRTILDWLERQPNLADAYVLDAWRLRQDKALPQAQGRLQQALALEPNNRRALVEMGILYEMMAMPERALALYERSLMVDPRQPEIAERVAQMRAKGIGRPLPD